MTEYLLTDFVTKLVDRILLPPFWSRVDWLGRLLGRLAGSTFGSTFGSTGWVDWLARLVGSIGCGDWLGRLVGSTVFGALGLSCPQKMGKIGRTFWS